MMAATATAVVVVVARLVGEVGGKVGVVGGKVSAWFWRTFKSQDRQKCTSTFFQATATTATNSSKISRARPKCTSTFWIKSETFR